MNNTCSGCGSVFFFAIGDKKGWRKTQGGLLNVFSFWKCPVCSRYNMIAGAVGFELVEMAKDCSLPLSTKVLLTSTALDPAILAQFSDEQIRAKAFHRRRVVVKEYYMDYSLRCSACGGLTTPPDEREEIRPLEHSEK